MNKKDVGGSRQETDGERGLESEHLKGVPLADLKEALAEAWVKRRGKEEEQGAVGGEEQHAGEPDEAVEVEEKNESLEIVRMKIELERERIALEREKMQAEINLQREKFLGEKRNKRLLIHWKLLTQATEYKLNAIDWDKPFNVCTDASEFCIAGCMSQTDDKGNQQPITFFSKKLDSTQQKWSTIEREAFAVIEMLKRVTAWVFGHKIHLFCDHNPLSFLTESAPKSAKLMRWALALAEYDIIFHYKEGKSNMMAVPDYLLRTG